MSKKRRTSRLMGDGFGIWYLIVFFIAWTWEGDLFREKCGEGYYWRPAARALIWPVTLARISYQGGPKIECSAAPPKDRQP